MREYLEDEEIETLAEEEMEETGAEFEGASEEIEVLAEDEKEATVGGGTWVRNQCMWLGTYTKTSHSATCKETFFKSLQTIDKAVWIRQAYAKKASFSGYTITVTRQAGKLGTSRIRLYGHKLGEAKCSRYCDFIINFK